jgi:hypothetical protein
MSQRNTLLNKRVRRMRRALRKGRLPAYIDLVHWLKLHGYADTTGQAHSLILNERVKSESHPLGIKIIELPDADGEMRKHRIFDPLVPANLRDTIYVTDA